jgi:hypothetical protein
MITKTTISLHTNKEEELNKYDKIFKNIEGLELDSKTEKTGITGIKRYSYYYIYRGDENSERTINGEGN